MRGREDGAGRAEGAVLPLPQAPEAIELRHLRAFAAVAEELSFSRAAARLYLSQPALSRQIRALERLVGCELLRRTTHRVGLTAAGEALLERTRRILLEVDDAVAVTRAAGGEAAGRIERLMRPLTAIATTACLPELREANEVLLAEFPVPAETDIRPVNANGVPSFVLNSGPERPATLLYLHGGGYTMGSAYGYRSLAGALCAAAGTAALLPEYRLAPENPYPAAVEDAVRAYRWMLERAPGADSLAVAGDSSGGGLVLCLLAALKREGLPLPGRAVLLCPWLDLSCRHLANSAPQAMLTVVRAAARDYLAGHPAGDPLLDPLSADLAGYPPVLVQAADADALVHEARLFVERARERGVEAVLDLYPVEEHVFHMFWSFLPEAADALANAAAFLRSPAPGAWSAR
ncbi:alpha/beta hydrolase fold domain-containing protein [Streptomyces sp. DSM 44917]|uniref:Alpha/beta hydrolase fold domain-containing protein n=1 Tax=Streptomyces boetiae TaxID=3075541 RepID=A0ABU2L3S9_9ACTN|nr:alpha/beta hydrolase fold domain-containing protein [Streptomyces sp. DSM 44917]MDT0306219.1 alpha/beta hydrolase fold domain-containing protein [Streptomyces sp. DSM 44917]